MAFARNKWYAATPTGLLASADRGANWTAAHIGALTKIPVESVRVSSDGKAIWIGSLISIAHSADGGATWKWIDLPPSLGVIQKLEVAENDVAHSGGSAPTLLVETYKGLFISRDAGKTWGAPGHGLPEVPVQDVAMAGSYFLAAMQFGGLYLSDDAGRTWRRLDGSVAEGLFSAVMTTRNSMGSSSVTGMPSSLKASDSPSPISYIIFYAASVTEGLYAIDVAPKLHVAPGGDTGH